MQIKNIGAGLLAGLAFFCLTPGTMALAAGNIWMDAHAEVQAKDFKRIVLFPIRYGDEADGRVNEGQEDNAALAKRINKRIKKTTFLRFEDPDDTAQADKEKEKRQILRENPAYDELLQHYPSEKDRAKAVYDTTGAEGYLLPHISMSRERIDHSPATPVTVRMESYYDEINGPHGSFSHLAYRSWLQPHVIPGRDLALQMMDMDFTLYDAYTGQKAMTLADYYRCYGVTREHAFDQIAKNFTGDWNRLKKSCKQKVSANAPTLGFASLTLPDAAARDEFSMRTIYYAYKDEALNQLRNLRVVDEPDAQNRYYVQGEITSYESGETWIPPSAYTMPQRVRTETFFWRDDRGNKHEGERIFYRTAIYDTFGSYRFWYRVGANLQLVDAATGEVLLAKSYREEDPDRYANALRAIFKSFYQSADRVVANGRAAS